MADYYQKLSILLSVNALGAKVVNMAEKLLRACERLSADNAGCGARGKNRGTLIMRLPKKISTCILYYGFGIELNREDDGLWVWGEESPNVTALVLVIQEALIRCKSKAIVAFEWSMDCSKPRLDAYGGGTVVIAADGWCSARTDLIMSSLVRAMEAGLSPSAREIPVLITRYGVPAPRKTKTKRRTKT